MDKESKESLVRDDKDPLIRILNKIVLTNVKVLAVLMVFVVVWGVADVIMRLYQQMTAAPSTAFDIENILTTLGYFLAVLIVVEIFLNIIFYMKKDAIHVPLVLGTALTAVSRKVIIMDYTAVSSYHILATAAVIMSVGVTFWLVTKKNSI